MRHNSPSKFDIHLFDIRHSFWTENQQKGIVAPKISNIKQGRLNADFLVNPKTVLLVFIARYRTFSCFGLLFDDFELKGIIYHNLI